MNRSVTATLDGASEVTGWISSRYKNPSGQLNISIDGSSDWDGTIALDRTFDDGVTYEEVDTWQDTDIETALTDQIRGIQYRLRCSERTAGQAEVRLWK